MATIELVTLALIFSAILIILAFIFKKKSWLLGIGGSIILIVAGIDMMGTGILFQTGEIANTTANITITDFSYTTQQNNLTGIVGGTLMILGFAGLVGGTININKLRFDEDEYDDHFKKDEEKDFQD